ncbi:AMP-binding protein [Kribbella sp. NPDC056345]|uniref:AMP-binding protein n=1 Tax=Kribbella sp. NPDC056345 TaxID=3345789 RepID=UPI0035E1ED7D
MQAVIVTLNPVAFIWCPINPRNEAAENRELLDRFDCEVLIYQSAFAPLVDRIRDALPKVHTFVCLDADPAGWDAFCGGASQPDLHEPEGLAMIVGTGGTTGQPKGVMLTNTNLETMTQFPDNCRDVGGSCVTEFVQVFSTAGSGQNL